MCDGRQRAFTLIEILLVMAIVLFLMMFGFTLLQPQWQQQRIENARYDLSAALYLARNRAATEHKDTFVCAANAGVCSLKNEWAGGWLVYQDQNDNRRIDSQDRLITTHNLMLDKEGFNITSNLANAGLVRFDASGNTETLATFVFNAPNGIKVYLCLGGAARIRHSEKVCE